MSQKEGKRVKEERIIIREKKMGGGIKKISAPLTDRTQPHLTWPGRDRARAGSSSYSLSVLRVTPEGAFEKHLHAAGFERLSSR